MKFKFIFILLNMFVWNYDLSENAETLLDTLSMVFQF